MAARGWGGSEIKFDCPFPPCRAQRPLVSCQDASFAQVTREFRSFQRIQTQPAQKKRSLRRWLKVPWRGLHISADHQTHALLPLDIGWSCRARRFYG